MAPSSEIRLKDGQWFPKNFCASCRRCLRCRKGVAFAARATSCNKPRLEFGFTQSESLRSSLCSLAMAMQQFIETTGQETSDVQTHSVAWVNASAPVETCSSAFLFSFAGVFQHFLALCLHGLDLLRGGRGGPSRGLLKFPLTPTIHCTQCCLAAFPVPFRKPRPSFPRQSCASKRWRSTQRSAPRPHLGRLG